MRLISTACWNLEQEYKQVKYEECEGGAVCDSAVLIKWLSTQRYTSVHEMTRSEGDPEYSGGLVDKVRSGCEIQGAKKSGRCGVILNVQDPFITRTTYSCIHCVACVCITDYGCLLTSVDAI